MIADLLRLVSFGHDRMEVLALERACKQADPKQADQAAAKNQCKPLDLSLRQQVSGAHHPHQLELELCPGREPICAWPELSSPGSSAGSSCVQGELVRPSSSSSSSAAPTSALKLAGSAAPQDGSRRTKAKGAGRAHLCLECGRSFSRSDMLTRHSRLHSGLKPYQCPRCKQVFSRSDHLSTHERTHTGEKPYRCALCSYSACRRDMITRHMRTHAASLAAGTQAASPTGRSMSLAERKRARHKQPSAKSDLRQDDCRSAELR